MPYKWVPPELFCKYENVRIYHAYKDESYYRELYYWYTLDVTENDTAFDIRDLCRSVNSKLSMEVQTNHRQVIELAIDKGIIGGKNE